MKRCSKCGNEKLIEGVRFCLNCGADVDTSSKKECCANKECNCRNNDNKKIVRTRLSVELFDILD